MMERRHLYFSKVKIGIVYFVLGAGGLWHILDNFQKAMRILDSPMMIGLAVWLWCEYWYVLAKKQKNHPNVKHKQYKFIWWSLMVLIGSFVVELLGVRTGKIFGSYSYGETLKPSIAQVPIAIGFAWLVMLLASIAVFQRLPLAKFTTSSIVSAFFISLLMIIFDFLMEPAAVKLGYWYWLRNRIPWQNYLAWFVLSFLFSQVGLRMELFREQIPSLALHAYLAQLLYFVLVNFSSI